MAGTDTLLVVGLGNPGSRYARTRHNVGHMVVDRIAEDVGGSFRAARRAQAMVIEGRMGTPGSGPRVILARTTGYMNTSGVPVSGLASFYGVPPQQVLVVHDDLDLPFGTLRLKQGGGEGGHNGLKDTSRALGTRDYLRLRVGVGRPPGRQHGTRRTRPGPRRGRRGRRTARPPRPRRRPTDRPRTTPRKPVTP
jgi:PTH1 family peptidyl-tRNA hydrolase